MQIIPLSSPLLAHSTASAALGAQATDALGGVISLMGAEGFGAEALAQLNRWLPVSWWSVFLWQAAQPPRMPLSGSFGAADHTQDSWQTYCKDLYLTDDTFDQARAYTPLQQRTLVHWHAHEVPTAHRERIYSRHGLRERVSVVSRTDDDALLVVNLYRHEDLASFRDAEMDALAQGSGLLLSCIQKHLGWMGSTTGAQPTAGAASTAMEAANPMNVLTTREREVCERMLKGWTYDGIAVDLGVASGTVKTYRDRAFEKLGIHHRNELFALAAGTLN